MKNLKLNKDYTSWLSEVKSKIRVAQIKTALAANSELIRFYWDLGKVINDKLTESNWGDKVLVHLSKDLQSEFPDSKGFSVRNLKYTKQFYVFYSSQNRQQAVAQMQSTEIQHGNKTNLFDQQLVGQLPWGHNIQIFTKAKSIDEAKFYINQTIENGWSRDVLSLQIKTDLYNRQGKSITNFKQTLPMPQSDLAQKTIKDPYTFDFLTMTKPYNERDVERQLIEHISKFLLELGKGFAFVGRQYHLEIDETDYYIDLLFYHTKLKCYVVIELKNTKFIPEYAGKLNFYLSAVDSLVKADDDKPTIGILLCRDKKKIETEFALRDISKPMGVSEFTLTEALPDNLKGNLPTVEELESEFGSANLDE
jgi:predicted nuclease of restriction endonuclease-like (RecB) superfamily